MSILTSGREKCGFCGGAWFGTVAYCPYCGNASGGAPVPTVADPAREANATPVADSAPMTDSAPVADSTSIVDSAPVVDLDRLALAAEDGPAPEHATHEPSAGTRRSGWKFMALALATVVGAVVLAAILFAVGQLAATSGGRAGPQQDPVRAPGGDAARSGTIPSNAGVPASAPAAPRAEMQPQPQAQQPAPPPHAPNRSLCSAANEAAGLCHAQ